MSFNLPKLVRSTLTLAARPYPSDAPVKRPGVHVATRLARLAAVAGFGIVLDRELRHAEDVELENQIALAAVPSPLAEQLEALREADAEAEALTADAAESGELSTAR